MKTLTPRWLLAVCGAAIATAGAMAAACGSSTESTFGDPDAGNGDGVFGTDGSFGTQGQPDAGDLYANDPPQKWCGPDGGAPPPAVGGTLDCPDDKNLPGCGCSTPGQQVACWTGKRAARNVGVCKDGITTCQKVSETTYAWGPCEGEVLPTGGATKGADACQCFSAGQWKIANISPCSYTYCSIDPDGGACPEANITQAVALSTQVDPATGLSHCPNPMPASPPTTAPTERWSTDTLKGDCAGRFTLCFRIRAGTFEAPSDADCVLGEVCAPAADYLQAGVEQPWPDLPGWMGTNETCARKWALTPASQSAGYGEMIVKGTSVRCETIGDPNGGDFVFNRVKYCPAICRDPANAQAPECVGCRQSGEGQF